MKNISINNENLQLNIGKTYIVIDALYLSEIKSEYKRTFQSLKQIRENIFPYTDTPFAEYIAKDPLFTLSKISKIDYAEVIEGDKLVFSTDTGLIIFVNENILWDFVNDFDYEKLVNSEIELLNYSYWEQIISSYDYRDIAIMISFQENKNEFDGSGTYKIG